MFDKVPPSPELVAGEHAMLRFWNESQTFEQLRAKNRGKPKWSFLDGPITANNPMGVHHAWGRTLKDVFQRYFAMTGHDERYQNGFDCQGLWVEVEVEKELGIQTKRDIENLVPGDRFQSIDKFVSACKARVDKFARRQTEQSIRLGYWMDWDRDEDWQKTPDARRSYYTMAQENNYTIWQFLKNCHTRQLIYKAYDSMPWCPRCAVGISQMEMHEGYQFVAHRAVFVRFPLRRPTTEPDAIPENLLVWTTTPWTLTSNVAAAVNPALTYLKIKHRDQYYYLAKGALTAARLEDDFKRGNWVEGVPKLKQVAQIFKEKGGFDVVAELPGSALIGWTYDGPFDELPAQSHAAGFPAEIAEVVKQQKWSPDVAAQAAHRVIAWDMVGETEGTGIVHIAPGCGKEDFELGKLHGLPPVAPLDEDGTFLDGFGPLNGRSAFAAETVDQILQSLTEKGLLVAVERYPHNYPHCWRCKTELLFRLVDEWYIHMGSEDDPGSYRRQIMRVTEQVTFLPESINGKARELDWLRNMGDWMISKKRYWGLALPIWTCDRDCGWFDVIGSRGELQERAIEGWDRFEGRPPHRPWVDLIKIRCAQCGSTAGRISDVGNPWLDAGIVPFSTVRYHSDRAYWEQWFPADFITECFPGQFRNWFYAILAMSTMMENRAPFRTLLGHALVRDEQGEEMHKSKGNAIWFDDAAEKMGADVMRWLYCRQNPTQNLNFGYTPGREVERQVFNTLWNSYAFFVNYARLDEFDPAAPAVPPAERPEIDRWMLSNLQLCVRNVRQQFEAFHTPGVVRAAEAIIEDLSNWYIRRNRRRFWRSRGEDDRDKLAAYQTLHEVLLTLCKLLAPIVPFLTERIYQNLTRGGEGRGAPHPALSPEGRGSELSSRPSSARGSELSSRPSSGRESELAAGQTRRGAPSASLAPRSVHLCDYPEPDPGLIDEKLSFEMQIAQRVVSAGHALRDEAAMRVRQPLSELRVALAGGDERAAVTKLQPLIADELNVKLVRVVESIDDLITLAAKPRFDVLGPRYGKQSGKIAGAIGKLPAAALGELQNGKPIPLTVDDQTVEIGPDTVELRMTAAAGWRPAQVAGIRLALLTTVTPELLREGMARDFVRHIQQRRKDLNLNIEDRIEVVYSTDDPELAAAIEEWKDYIMAECLCTKLEMGTVDAAAPEVAIGDKKLRFEVRKQ